jgi:hypothetical protein
MLMGQNGDRGLPGGKPAWGPAGRAALDRVLRERLRSAAEVLAGHRSGPTDSPRVQATSRHEGRDKHYCSSEQEGRRNAGPVSYEPAEQSTDRR